jgi:tetratricopeptide (TPR) repeat protein
VTRGQPKTRAGELLDKINTLSADDRGNEFLLMSLAREARQVLGTGEIAFGNMMLGALAAMRQDVSQARAFHEKAVNAEPRNPDILINYAISLYRLGALDDSIEMANRAWKLDESREDVHELLVQLTSSGGRLRDAAQCLREVNSMPESYTADIKDAASLLAERGISDDAASAIVRAAFAVVPPLSLESVGNRVAADDETKWVDFALKVNGSLEKIMELNFTFAERMAELTLDSEIGRASSAFVVRFTRNIGTDAGSSR